MSSDSSNPIDIPAEGQFPSDEAAGMEPVLTGGEAATPVTSEGEPPAADMAATGEPDAPAPEEPRRPRRPSKLPAVDVVPEAKMDWYILKVQSNRENSIAEALERRVKMAGMEAQFTDIIVPTETRTEFKAGKKKVVKAKLYPGYIVVRMAIDDDTWFLVRETPGIGDFTGSAGKPTPMLPHEVAKILPKQGSQDTEAPKLQIPFEQGDRVKINEGTFENFEGEVSHIDAASGRVTVMINIFGRSTPVELEYWQVEKM